MHFAAALIVTGGQDKTILVHSTEQGVDGMFVYYVCCEHNIVVYLFSLVTYYVVLCSVHVGPKLLKYSNGNFNVGNPCIVILLLIMQLFTQHALTTCLLFDFRSSRALHWSHSSDHSHYCDG